MTYPYTILFMDNLPDQVAPRIQLLRGCGYRVLPASTLEAAVEIMEEERVHLAIMDINMIDETDSKDVSGLALAKDPRFVTIPKIIYTGHPSLETMRATLKYPLMGMPEAVDYVVKRDSDETFLGAIEQAVERFVRINRDLEITYLRNGKSIEAMVGDIEPGLDRSRRSVRFYEMEDLFRSLFFECRQITISNVFWTIGNQFAVEILAYKDGAEEKFIVVGGRVETIRAELKTYARRVPKANKTGILAPFQSTEGVHYGLRSFPIPLDGSSAGEVKTLYEFYQNHPANQTREVLSHLFGSILGGWRNREPDVKEIAVIEHYRQKLGLPAAQDGAFQALLEKLCHECTVRNIAEFCLEPNRWSVSIHKGPTFKLGDPLAPLNSPEPAPVKARFGLSTGGLSVETVLVGQSRDILLTDYSQVTQAPAWQDFVTLEHSIRLLNLRSDLQSLLTVEKSLLSASRLDEYGSLNDVDGELKRTAGMIQMVRQEAANLKEFGLAEYLLAEYCYILRDLATYAGGSTLPTPYLKKYAYLLALAGMVSARLGQLSQGDGPSSTARLSILDPVAHQVLVGDRIVDLTTQEFALFQFLYSHADKVCTRQDIFKAVYRIERTSDADENMLTQNMSRIRKKIETNPNQPAYLQTVQGVGYKLNTLPH